MLPAVRTSLLAAAALALAGCASIDRRLAACGDPVRAVGEWYELDVGDPSCAVATSDGGAYGDVHALYRIASVSKLFMALASERLAASGAVSLDRPVTELARPGLPPEFGAVTVRDLLSHRSGLPRELLRTSSPSDVAHAISCGFFDRDLYAGLNEPDALMRELSKPVWREAVRGRNGSKYSNVGFGIAWMAIQDCTKRSFGEIAQRELFEPEGLVETAFDPASRPGLKAMKPCCGDIPWLKRRGSAAAEHPLGPVFSPGGGLWASASDCLAMARLCWPGIDRALAEHGGEASVADGEIVAGLSARRLADGRLVLFRSGMIYGGASFVGFDVQSRRVAVILRNVTSWPDDIGFWLLSQGRLGRKED